MQKEIKGMLKKAWKEKERIENMKVQEKKGRKERKIAQVQEKE
jgi:hypothetical protein